jgi:hypothetical protein
MREASGIPELQLSFWKVKHEAEENNPNAQPILVSRVCV